MDLESEINFNHQKTFEVQHKFRCSGHKITNSHFNSILTTELD